MPKGQVIEVNGIRYESVEDSDLPNGTNPCGLCDYKKDMGRCYAFCCEMELYGCHFKRLDKCK